MLQCLKQHNLLNSTYMKVRLLGPFKNFLLHLALNREDFCCKLRTCLTSYNEWLRLSAISLYHTVTRPQDLTNTATIQLMALLMKSAVKFCPQFKLSRRSYIIKLAEQVKKHFPGLPWLHFIQLHYDFYHDAPVFKLAINSKIKRIRNTGKEKGCWKIN